MRIGAKRFQAFGRKRNKAIKCKQPDFPVKESQAVCRFLQIPVQGWSPFAY